MQNLMKKKMRIPKECVPNFGNAWRENTTPKTLSNEWVKGYFPVFYIYLFKIVRFV